MRLQVFVNANKVDQRCASTLLSQNYYQMCLSGLFIKVDDISETYQ